MMKRIVFLTIFLLKPVIIDAAALNLLKEKLTAADLLFQMTRFGSRIIELPSDQSAHELENNLKVFIHLFYSDGKAVHITIPHEKGHLHQAAQKAGFVNYYSNDHVIEWVFKNKSGMPDSCTATNTARVLVFTKENGEERVLLVKDRYKQDLVLPGGAVDKQEYPRDAAARECAEEVGLIFNPESLVLVALATKVKANRFGVTNSTHYFAVHIPAHDASVHIDQDEITGFFWVPVQSIIAALSLPKENKECSVSELTATIIKHVVNKEQSCDHAMKDYDNKETLVTFIGRSSSL